MGILLAFLLIAVFWIFLSVVQFLLFGIAGLLVFLAWRKWHVHIPFRSPEIRRQTYWLVTVAIWTLCLLAFVTMRYRGV